MKNKAYVFDPVTREFVGVVLLEKDQLGGGFIEMPNTVGFAPDLAALGDNEAAVLSSDGMSWERVADFRRLSVFDKASGVESVIESLGDLPSGVTLKKPEHKDGMVVDGFDAKKDEWKYRKDMRGVVVYRKSDGSHLTLGSDAVGVPDGYTDVEPKSRADVWDAKTGKWVFSEARKAEVEAAEKKAKVPSVVTIRQAKRALLQVGLLDDVDAVMESDAVPRETKIDWKEAVEVRREWVESSGLKSVLKMSEDDLDNLFLLAGTF